MTQPAASPFLSVLLDRFVPRQAVTKVSGVALSTEFDDVMQVTH